MDRAQYDRELWVFDAVMHRLNMEHLSLAERDPHHHVIVVEREIHIYRMQKIMDQYHLEKDQGIS